MPCVKLGNAILCGFHPTYTYEGFIFECHSYCGPAPVAKNDHSHIRDTIPKGFWQMIDRFQREPHRDKFLCQCGQCNVTL